MAILDGRCAAALRCMVDPWLRQLRANGYRLSDDDEYLIGCLDELAKLHSGVSATSLAAPIVWVSTAEAAERAGTTAQAIRDAARFGTLKDRRVGRLIEVSESSLGSWIELRDERRLAKLRKAPQTTQRRRSA